MRTRAAVLTAALSPFTTAEVELDQLRPREVRVRMVAAGFCHTDLGVKLGGLPFPLPGILGHEGAGIVDEVGSEVTSVVPGDKVILSFTSCGECAGCRSGHPAYCATWLPRNIFAGARDDGSATVTWEGAPIGAHFFGQSSFAEVAIADERSVVRVDPDADLTVLAPLGCGVQTGVGSVWNVIDPAPGSSLAIFGAGAVGLSALMAAALRDLAAVVAIDLVPARLDLARELGATHVIDAGRDDVAARLVEITGGRGLDHAFDTTANPGVARTALDALGIGGTLVVCGAPPPGTEVPVDIQGILPGKRLIGVTMGDSNPSELVPALVSLHREGRLPLEKLIEYYTLDDLERAADDMHHGRTIKPVVRF